MRKPSYKQVKKANESRVAEAYYAVASGVQIPIWEIGKIQAVGLAAIAAGASEEMLREEIRAYVEQIRVG